MGSIALMDIAREKFKFEKASEEKGVGFSYFKYQHLKWAMFKAFKSGSLLNTEKFKTKYGAYSADLGHSNDWGQKGQGSYFDSKEVVKSILDGCETVSKRNREIFEEYYLSGKSISDLGEKWGVTGERIRQIAQKARGQFEKYLRFQEKGLNESEGLSHNHTRTRRKMTKSFKELSNQPTLPRGGSTSSGAMPKRLIKS